MPWTFHFPTLHLRYNISIHPFFITPLSQYNTCYHGSCEKTCPNQYKWKWHAVLNDIPRRYVEKNLTALLSTKKKWTPISFDRTRRSRGVAEIIWFFRFSATRHAIVQNIKNQISRRVIVCFLDLLQSDTLFPKSTSITSRSQPRHIPRLRAYLPYSSSPSRSSHSRLII